MGKENYTIYYLLSDQLWNVCRLHLERTVLGPQVDRICDARAAPLINHLGRFRACDCKLEVGIFLPVSEEEWEFEEESVVGVAEGGERLRAGVAREATVEGLAGPNKLLPVLEAVWVGVLQQSEKRKSSARAGMRRDANLSLGAAAAATYHFGPQPLDLGILLI